MHLVSINVAEPQMFDNGRGPYKTGIFKRPVAGPVRIAHLGVEGDAVVNQKHHGGPDQAVYVYTMPDYRWWSAELARELQPGIFGENLTLSHLESSQLAIGDLLHVGEVVLQIAAPRIPCRTLAARLGDLGFIKQYRQAMRPGAYCRVVQTGTVSAGDAVRLEPYSGDRVTLDKLFDDYQRRKLDAAVLERYLALPIGERTRNTFERRLQALQ